MKKVFLGPWGAESYERALRRLGAEVEREDAGGCGYLLLPGGGDLHPGWYGQKNRGSCDINLRRDAAELSSFREFFLTGRPIFGICRGMQLINTALGGTLSQHIPGHSQVRGADRRHAVHTADPLLLGLCGPRFTVNSAHHQAVDAPGKNLEIIARAADGTPEALRHRIRPVLAVQWHPERLGEAGEELLRLFLKENLP